MFIYSYFISCPILLYYPMCLKCNDLTWYYCIWRCMYWYVCVHVYELNCCLSSEVGYVFQSCVKHIICVSVWERNRSQSKLHVWLLSGRSVRSERGRIFYLNIFSGFDHLIIPLTADFTRFAFVIVWKGNEEMSVIWKTLHDNKTSGFFHLSLDSWGEFFSSIHDTRL